MSKNLIDGTTVPSIAYHMILEYKDQTQNTAWANTFGKDRRVEEMSRKEFLRAYNEAYEYFKTMI